MWYDYIFAEPFSEIWIIFMIFGIIISLLKIII